MNFDFAGETEDDARRYTELWGHAKMPVVMKGGLWALTADMVEWLLAAHRAAGVVSWKLWPSDDDSMGLLFGTLDIQRPHVAESGRLRPSGAAS